MTGPERLKPRDITDEGLRMLHPLRADEINITICPEAGRFNPTDAGGAAS